MMSFILFLHEISILASEMKLFIVRTFAELLSHTVAVACTHGYTSSYTFPVYADISLYRIIRTMRDLA